jgi:dCMP deaminase
MARRIEGNSSRAHLGRGPQARGALHDDRAIPDGQTKKGPVGVRRRGVETRADWDHYFLNIARETATRSNCLRRRYGAVIVRNRRICSTGYNGPPCGHPHCDEGACPRSRSEAASGWGHDNCIAIHAEANAILYSSPEQRQLATIYITGVPCFTCAKLIANSGITEVVATGESYEGWNGVRRFLMDCDVRVRLIP